MGDFIPSTIQEISATFVIFDKACSLVNYYGKTNASAEFYFSDTNLGVDLKTTRLILNYLKRTKCLPDLGKSQNVFGPTDPSIGFTNWNKPHAEYINYYTYDTKTFKAIYKPLLLVAKCLVHNL